jgi:hypothetical protein
VKRSSQLLAAALIASFAVGATQGAGPGDSSADRPPKRTALTEKVEKRLVQLDVGVEGDPEAIRGITAKDLVLYVGEHEIQGLIVDPACGDAPAPQGTPTQAEEPAPRASRLPATLTLFFDQPHLTTMGRSRSLETATELINRLVIDGARASIVSNSKRLETIVPLTEDRAKLLAGLERIRNDPSQWDSYAEGERGRAREAVDVFTHTNYPSCPPLIAKAYARDEFLIARRSTERLAIAVGTLAEVPAPKALVYFGDTLRKFAGLHYLQMFAFCSGTKTLKVNSADRTDREGVTIRGGSDVFNEIASAGLTPSAGAEFNAVIIEALARGVHFYTIQAEGLLVYRPAGWDAKRHQHAEDALVSLATETGGEAFLGGASNKVIADTIESRSSCRLLLSFPPGGLPRDKAMNVTLELHVPNVKVHTQGRIVVPSPASIEKSRLLAAFVDPTSSDDGSLRALLIPRGGDGKTWKAAVQLRLRPTGLPDNSAELGASVVRRDKVTNHFASSIATASGARAMVLEKSLDIAPGAFAVVAVARDAKRGDIGSSRVEADWPNPVKSLAAIAPIAVLQSGKAAMTTDGSVSTSGSLARDVDEVLEAASGITLESVVCRGARTNAPIVVERWLDDGQANEFAPMTIRPSDDPCIRTIDVVRAGRLGPAAVDYHVVARLGDQIVAQEQRTLRVAATP